MFLIDIHKICLRKVDPLHGRRNEIDNVEDAIRKYPKAIRNDTQTVG